MGCEWSYTYIIQIPTFNFIGMLIGGMFQPNSSGEGTIPAHRRLKTKKTRRWRTFKAGGSPLADCGLKVAQFTEPIFSYSVLNSVLNFSTDSYSQRADERVFFCFDSI